jgi:GDP-L-fucose synthase
MEEIRFRVEGKRVWVAGHAGMVGSALSRRLARLDCELLTVSRSELDLRRQTQVEDWMRAHRPDAVILAAATVGGILANDSRPVDFLYDNLAIAGNVIHAAAEAGVNKLMFLGSSCFYPRLAEQPIHEDSLLTGPLEPTNEWYAVAKIAGAKLCQAYRRQQGLDFIAVAPTNLYGPGDNFDPLASHVVPALVRRFHEARLSARPAVEIWGTGTPRRELLFVEDACDALLFLMERYSSEQIINVAGGEVVSIRELAELIAGIVGYHGDIRYDTSRPDGMPHKALSAERILAMGWKPRTGLREGLRRTYEWYLGRIGDPAHSVPRNRQVTGASA